MPIEFKGGPKPTLGVEVEVQLVHQESKDLTPGALDILKDADPIQALRAKAELTQSMIEINTEICQTVSQVGEDLRKQIAKLSAIASRHQIDLAVAGTHPFQAWWQRKVFPTDRYFQILEKFQWLARRLTVFGLHVHVGIQDGDRAVAVINALISYIPHLLALSASSPFWGGRDTGLNSCRVAILESLPTGGLPYFFVDWKEFQKCFEVLSSGGAIRSIKDIYWDIRPHFDFGTIEVRLCDGLSSMKETLALVALIQCLVVWIDDQYQKGKRSRQIHMRRYWLAPENKWQAARYGLDGQIIVQEGDSRKPLKEEIEQLLEILGPVAATLQCQKELSYVRDILKNGNGAARQRNVFEKTQSLPVVVDSLIEELKRDLY